MDQDYQVRRLSSEEAEKIQPELCELLIDTVSNGASIGFLPPISFETASAYWEGVINDLDTRNRILLVAQEENEVLGVVQLEIVTKENARHRAEIQKLMVHTRHRNKGVGKALITEIENIARAKERTLLVLDTIQGDTAEKLYEKWGYIRAGVIPHYAKWTDGELHSTVIFYKRV
jgi:ribosomal protein S18 acetylase RimI-like enzyme